MIATFKKYQNRLFTFGDQAIVSGSNFLVSMLLARHLGVELFGEFALAWMVILCVSSLHQAAIVSPLYSLYYKSQNQSAFLKHLHLINLGFVFLILLGLLAIAGITNIITPSWELSELIVIACTTGLYVFYDFLRRETFLHKKSIFVFITDCLAFGLQPIVFYFMADELSFSYVFVTIALMLFISTFLLIAIRYTHFKKLILKKVDYKNLREDFYTIFEYSKYLIGTAILQWFSGNFFVIAASAMLGTAAVGAIRIAQNLVGVLHIIFAALENIVPGAAACIYHQQGSKAMYDYFRAMAMKTGLLVIGILFIIFIFKRELIIHLYGDQYLDYQLLLSGYCVLYLFVYTGTIYRFIIRTLEKNSIIFVSYILTSGVSLVGAYPMIDLFGLYGVLIGLFLTQSLTLIVFIYSTQTAVLWNAKSYISS